MGGRSDKGGAALADYCVYTIVHGARLHQLARAGRGGRFTEGKPWITGRGIWLQARANRQVVAVLLAVACSCSDLLYWGILKSVSVADGRTRYKVDKLRRFRGLHRSQELVLRNTGRRIAPGFIRPYAICRTPRFIAPGTRPNNRLQPTAAGAILSRRG